MSLTAPTLADPITPSDAWRQAAARETPFGQYIGEKLLGGLEATRPVQALEQAMLPPRSGVPDEYGFVAPPGPSPVLGKEAWETGPHFRPGIEYDPGMTEARAEALATQKDRLDWNKSLIERYQGGYLGEAAGFVAGLAPGVADPTNYIPLLGPAAKAAMVARLGVIGGNIALHGAEAAANTALFEPLTASHAATFGQPYGWEDAAADIALGALAGSVGGAIHGGLEYRGSLREAATRTRLDQVMAGADATSLAAEQLDRGLPVDVAPVLAGRLPEAPRPAAFDVGGIVPRRAGDAAAAGVAPEHVAAASVRVDGEVFTGADHAEAMQKAVDALGEEKVDALAQAELEKHWTGDAVFGFVTDKGRWLSSAEAGPLAARADQSRPFDGETRAEARRRMAANTEATSEQIEMGRVGPEAGTRASPSFATATPEAPHPSVAEAAKRVGKAEADPLATFKQDAGLEGYQAPLPGHEPKPEPVPGEPAPAKPERPPTREEKAAALAALPPELAEIEAMRREGSFTPGDEATLAAGEAEAQRAESYAAAWTTLAGCVARNAA